MRSQKLRFYLSFIFSYKLQKINMTTIAIEIKNNVIITGPVLINISEKPQQESQSQII